MSNENTMTQRPLVNGFYPVSVLDIEATMNTTYAQAEAMSAMFNTIRRLTNDPDIRKLCEHGATEAELQAEDIDVLREQAVKAGLSAHDVCQVQSTATV